MGGGLRISPNNESMSGELEIQLQRDLGRLEGKVDALLYELRTSNKAQQSILAEHGRRIASLEKWRTGIVAGGLVLSAVFTVAFKIISIL